MATIIQAQRWDSAASADSVGADRHAWKSAQPSSARIRAASGRPNSTAN